MITAISEIDGKIFRGGGAFKIPPYLSLLEEYGHDKFTFRQANAKIAGFTRSVTHDLLSAGLIKSVTRTYPYYYRVHQPIPTHKLTRKEIIDRIRMRNCASGVARYD